MGMEKEENRLLLYQNRREGKKSALADPRGKRRAVLGEWKKRKEKEK